MNSFKNFFRSLPFKLSIIITAIVFLTFVVMVVHISGMVHSNMYKVAVERSDNAINNVVKRVDISMQEAQEEISNVVGKIDDSKITKYFLEENYSWAATTKLAYLEAKNGVYGYFTYKDSLGRIIDRKFNSKEEFEDWGWYKTAIEAGKSIWSNPFYNHTQKCIVNTYSCPIYDSVTGKMSAIWAVDVKFVELAEFLKSHIPYDDSYGYILSNDGHYMAHPDKNCELKTYEELDIQYHNESEQRIHELLLVSDDGNEVIKKDGENYLVTYRTIPVIGASLAIVCPFREVFKEVLFVQDFIWQRLIIALIVVAISILGLIYLVLKPLRGFAKAVRAVARGKYDTPLPKVTSRDELRDFHDAMSYMQQSLESNIEQLKESTAAAARIDSELTFAANIQQSLLVHNFSPYIEWPQLELFAKLQPARAVGGDLYDFFIRDSKLFFVIADVSGKGIPASLFMAMACKVFRVIASKEDSPAAIAGQLNKALAEHNKENMFITMFLGVMDLLSGEIKYINAGHNPPLIIAQSLRYMELEPSVPIAAFDNWEFKEHSIRLEDGEALLLYTDGVVEAENPKKELYGEDRLLSINKALSVKEIVDSVYSSVVEFSDGAEQSDDITILCLRYHSSFISFRTLEDIDKLPGFVDNCINSCSQNGLRLLRRNTPRNDGKLSLRGNKCDRGNPVSTERSLQCESERTAIGSTETPWQMLNLALEELIVNVLQYGQTDRCNLSVRSIGNELKFSIVDGGIAFNPTTAAEVDINANPSERNIGGLGIHFAKEIFSKLEYKRIANLNILYAYFPLQ